MAADGYLQAPRTNALNAAAAAPLRGTRKSPVLSRTSYQTIPASFGRAIATRDPRQAQFGIKLMF